MTRSLSDIAIQIRGLLAEAEQRVYKKHFIRALDRTPLTERERRRLIREFDKGNLHQLFEGAV